MILLTIPETTVSQKVENVSEVCSIPIQEETTVRFSDQGMPSTEHDSQHRMRVLGQGQNRGRVYVPSNVQFNLNKKLTC